MRHFQSIVIALLFGAISAPPAVFAQALLPVVVIEKPGGDSEVRRQVVGEFKTPSKLEWSAVLNSVEVVLELYGVECCDPPPQFTLAPARLVYLRNGQGGVLYFRASKPSGGGGVVERTSLQHPAILLDHPGTATVALIDLKPDYLYVLDFRVSERDLPFEVAGDRINSSQSGHVLTIVSTDSKGYARITIDFVHQTDPRKNWDWLLFDVVVSELQRAR